VATVDTSDARESGVDEVVERSPEILRKVRYVQEKKAMEEFLYEIGHDTGLATYGENEVRQALERGAVKTLLLSEGLDIVGVVVNCTSCGYSNQETMKERMVGGFEQNLTGKPCPKCDTPTLVVAEVKDLIEDFAELAEQVGSNVEIISVSTEEGQMLKNSFGGIAATLRFKPSG